MAATPTPAEEFRAEVRAFVAGLVPPGWTGIGALPSAIDQGTRTAAAL